MSSYFRACAQSAPALVTASPDAVALLQVQGVAPVFDEDEGGDGDRDGPSTPSTSGVPVGRSKPRVDPRRIEQVIAQTRELLDGPHANDIRLHLKREEAVLAREVLRAHNAAVRAQEVSDRTDAIVLEVTATKAAVNNASADQQHHDVGEPIATNVSAHASTVASRVSSAAPRVTHHPLSTSALSTLSPADAVSETDAFRRLRVEELRQRMEAERQRDGGAGSSIVARYAIEDAFLTDYGAAAAAEALLDYTTTPPPPPPPPRTANAVSHSIVRPSKLTASLAPSNGSHHSPGNSSGVATTLSCPLGLRSIDEAAAEERAAAKARDRLELLAEKSRAVQMTKTVVAAREDAERAEREARIAHEHEERQRALDESRFQLLATQRKAALAQQRHGGSIIAAESGSTAAARPPVSGAALVSGLAPGTSLLRAAPVAHKTRVSLGGAAHVLVSAEVDERNRAQRTEDHAVKEHPIDAYQRRVREDMLRERGIDMSSADANLLLHATRRDESLLILGKSLSGSAAIHGGM